jgi:hypothetical protein
LRPFCEGTVGLLAPLTTREIMEPVDTGLGFGTCAIIDSAVGVVPLLRLS